MASNKAFTLQVKNNQNTYTELYPRTVKEQVLGWSIGEIYGPFIMVLKAQGWYNKEQVISMKGATENDFPIGVKVLYGTEEEMRAQDIAYSKLKPNGIESLNNQIKFTCDEVPDVDLQVQVWWTK